MLSELLTTDRVRVPLGSHSKADLLRELARLAVPEADPETLEQIVAAVEEREAQVSTAMGGGLAVPHGRTDVFPQLRMAAGLVRDVRDYHAPDDAPVVIAFLVLTPQQASTQHVKLLARIARLMHKPELRTALLAAQTAEQFVDVILRSEAA